MTDTITYTLKKPVTVDSKTYSEFTFREATAGDMAAGDHFDGAFTKTLAILAGMAGVPLNAMKAVKASDIGPLTEAVAPLLGESGTAAG